MVSKPLRISVEQARQDMESQNALLVCAYDSDEKFQQNHLEGALSLDEFRSRVDDLDKGQEVIFYCA